MDISTVVIIALAAALVAVLAHKALLSKFSDRYQAEAERVERERRRAERKSGPSRAGEGAAKIGRALPLSRAASDELRPAPATRSPSRRARPAGLRSA